MCKKSLRLQCSSEKSSARCLGSPRAQAASYGNPTLGREGPAPLARTLAGSSLGEHGLRMKSAEGSEASEFTRVQRPSVPVLGKTCKQYLLNTHVQCFSLGPCTNLSCNFLPLVKAWGQGPPLRFSNSQVPPHPAGPSPGSRVLPAQLPATSRLGRRRRGGSGGRWKLGGRPPRFTEETAGNRCRVSHSRNACVGI